MKRYFAINDKGLEEIQTLRNIFLQSVEQITQATIEMQKRIIELGDSLGGYEDNIILSAQQLRTLLEQKADDIHTVIQGLDKTAELIERFKNEANAEEWISIDNKIQQHGGVGSVNWKHFGVDCARLIVEELEPVLNSFPGIAVGDIAAKSMTEKIEDNTDSKGTAPPELSPAQLKETRKQDELNMMMEEARNGWVSRVPSYQRISHHYEKVFNTFAADEVRDMASLDLAGKIYAKEHGMVAECGNAKGYIDLKIGKMLFYELKLWKDESIQNYYITSEGQSEEVLNAELSSSGFASMEEMVGQCVSEYMNTRERPEDWPRDKNEPGVCRTLPNLVAHEILTREYTGTGGTDDEISKMMFELNNVIDEIGKMKGE